MKILRVQRFYRGLYTDIWEMDIEWKDGRIITYRGWIGGEGYYDQNGNRLDNESEEKVNNQIRSASLFSPSIKFDDVKEYYSA